MKTVWFRTRGWRWVVALSWFSFFASHGTAQQLRPQITSIRPDGTNIVVQVQAPAGIRRVTLECRERLGPGGWEPRSVARLDGSGGFVTFRITRSRQTEMMRVRGDTIESLPVSFYSGTSNFIGEPGTGPGPAGALAFADTRGAPGSTVPAEPSRAVVESDIWKIRSNTLYFFNQHRGLQIIDISNVDAPLLQSTYALPASGEQMYPLGENHIVLLARNGCYYSSNGEESQVLILRDERGAAGFATRLPVSGYIRESRLVGTALYVASQTYRRTTNGATVYWEWGTVVSAFDLSIPDAPVSRGTLWHSGYGHEVAATDRYLFVITQSPTNWWQSIVHLVDISSPDGVMRPLGSVQPAGRVPDKFKIHVSGEVLTIISQVQNTMLNTELETFSLADPANPRKLGTLTLGMSEQLHATRFDGDRVYVVTFHVQFRIDPLWVVDLSDPTRPTIKGELEIPGWSTFLQPLGNRLVALGIETNRTTVSLFDVTDPASPALLSRVALGDGWSWTEGNWDEKAFNVLADEGLILVPFQSWTTNGYTRQVQLIDLSNNSLALRGVIDHKFQPRRATLVRNRILSISALELLSVDATDRDHPELRTRLELAWPVDRVFVHGNHLVEISTSSRSWGWWYYAEQTRPVIRVVEAGASDHVLTSVTLSNSLPVIGATKRGDHLYIAQSAAFWFPPWIVYADGTTGPATNTNVFVLTVLALDRLPQLTVAGQAQTIPSAPGWGSAVDAVWPRPGVLVWAGGGFDFWWFRAGSIDAPALNARASFAPFPWFWPAAGGQLLAFNVADPTAPTIASEVSLMDTNRFGFSEAFTAEGLIYVSHQTSEFVPGLETPWMRPAYTNVVVDGSTGMAVTNVYPAGSWVQRHFLDVVDFASAEHPAVRAPLSISGTLQGVSHQGSLLYALSTEWTGTNGYSWREKVDALAYDGVAAHLVDSLPLASSWPRPLRVVGENLFLGRSGFDYTTTNRYPHYLEAWHLPDTGKFEKRGSLQLDLPAQSLENFPGMLALQQTDNTVLLVDHINPANLGIFGRRSPGGCLWVNLDHADGNSIDGLWIPLGGFGVLHVPVTR